MQKTKGPVSVSPWKGICQDELVSIHVAVPAPGLQGRSQEPWKSGTWSDRREVLAGLVLANIRPELVTSAISSMR